MHGMRSLAFCAVCCELGICRQGTNASGLCTAAAALTSVLYCMVVTRRLVTAYLHVASIVQ